MLRLAAILVLLLVFAGGSASAEETPAQSRQVQSIVRNTASPFCPGKTLDSCPSPKAAEWRRDIREWVGEGVPDPEIRERLQARVPGFDLGIPPVKSGWVIPVIAVVLSTWWLVAMTRRFRRGRASTRQVEAPTQDPTLDARLDRELARLD